MVWFNRSRLGHVMLDFIDSSMKAIAGVKKCRIIPKKNVAVQKIEIPHGDFKILSL
jgi:hypothetical protein